MSSQHTRGPWQFYADTPSTDPNWHIVTDASRTRVLANVHIEPGNEMDLANARLIAAAPELLQALKELLRYAPGRYFDDERSDNEIAAGKQAAFAVARAAIAKALGEAGQ